MSDAVNQGQATFWANAAAWVEYQQGMDTALQPVLDRLLAAVALQPGEHVLDIGCGTGASTLAAARLVGDAGHVTGADISPLLLKRACKRLSDIANADALHCDAQTHAFPAGGFDCVMSRFGVMFFDDPVAAFTNIAAALKPGGRLVFLAWSALPKNPWFDTPRSAVLDQLGPQPPSDPRAPGPMAFADPEYVRGILNDAGLSDVSVSEVTLDTTPPGNAADTAHLICRIGVAGRVMNELGGTDADVQAIEASVARNFAQFETGEGTRVPAVLNLCTARRS